MAWTDIAWIVVVCTSANHLGLVKAVEGVIHHRLPIVNCVKCFTFWSTLIYTLAVAVPCASLQGFISILPQSLALSFLASYTAIWLELLMFSIDTLYNHIYGKLIQNAEEIEDN